MKTSIEDLTKDSARVNKKFNEDFTAVFDFDPELVDKIGKMRKEQDRFKTALEELERQYAEQEEKFTPEVMRKIEREVYLKVLDTLWMQHLENMQHLREGIHWRSIGQRDPLVEYRSESQKLFDGLEKNLREEVLRILLTITPQEAHNEGVTDGEEYDTELTKMAESATEKGVNEVSAGEKNLDKEFRDGIEKVAAQRLLAAPTRSVILPEKTRKSNVRIRRKGNSDKTLRRRNCSGFGCERFTH